MAEVLIIDDDQTIRDTLEDILEYEGHAVSLAHNGVLGLEMIADKVYDLVLCDINLPRLSGIDILREINKLSLEAQVVMISGQGNVADVVEAMREGALDFIEKPLDLDRILRTIKYFTEGGKSKKIRKLFKEIEYNYDKKGDKKSVVVPVRLWEEILSKIKAMF